MATQNKPELDYLRHPHLTPEHYESEGKGWEISKRNARPEFLRSLEAFLKEKKALIRDVKRAA